jgi:hypothetical protein
MREEDVPENWVIPLVRRILLSKLRREEEDWRT